VADGWTGGPCEMRQLGQGKEEGRKIKQKRGEGEIQKRGSRKF